MKPLLSVAGHQRALSVDALGSMMVGKGTGGDRLTIESSDSEPKESSIGFRSQNDAGVQQNTVRLHSGVEDSEGFQKYLSLEAYHSASDSWIPGLKMDFNDLTDQGTSTFNTAVKHTSF